MYAYIFGKVRKISTDFIVLENNNIGYKIITPNPYIFFQDEVRLVHLYLHIRDDAHELYGFRTEEEKNLFEKLISVTGIGPKSACAILALGDCDHVVEAIENGNVSYLTKFPKVGPKTAQQIILDLKGKLGHMHTLIFNKEIEESHDALIALGYKEKEIERVFKQIAAKNLTTQEYITKALQLMLK